MRVGKSNFFCTPETRSDDRRRIGFLSIQEYPLMPSYDKPNRSQYFNGLRYDQMAEDLQLTGKAQRTVHGYLRAVRTSFQTAT
jgi:hypothetical protein